MIPPAVEIYFVVVVHNVVVEVFVRTVLFDSLNKLGNALRLHIQIHHFRKIQVYQFVYHLFDFSLGKVGGLFF